MYSIQLLTLCENDRFLIIELMFLIRLDFGMEQITMETIQWSEVINSLSTYFASSGYNLSDPEKKQNNTGGHGCTRLPSPACRVRFNDDQTSDQVVSVAKS